LRKKDAAKIAELNDELTLPEFPRELSYLWRVYHRIRRRMAGGFAGPNPIGWQDIGAFMHVTRFRLAPWEIELLEAIDDSYLQPIYTALKDKNKKPAEVEMIDATDTKRIRNLMRSIGKRRSGNKNGGAPSLT
jgi:hypothetical protein